MENRSRNLFGKHCTPSTLFLFFDLQNGPFEIRVVEQIPDDCAEFIHSKWRRFVKASAGQKVESEKSQETTPTADKPGCNLM
jgi:hypothetical protein